MFVEIRSLGKDRLFYSGCVLLNEASTIYALTTSSFLNLTSLGEEKQTKFLGSHRLDGRRFSFRKRRLEGR